VDLTAEDEEEQLPELAGPRQEEAGPSSTPHGRRAGYTREQHSLVKKLFGKHIVERRITIEDVGYGLRRAAEDERSALSGFTKKQLYDKIRSMFKRGADSGHGPELPWDM
jgi:hypothetical protein